MAIPVKEEKGFDASALTAGGIGLIKGKSKTLQKQEQDVQRIALEEERVYRKGISSIKDLIAPSSMRIEPNSVRLGDVFVRTLFIITYPRYVTVGWASPIINLNAQMDMRCSFIQLKQMSS